jgi:predicted lipid-binding transport protein (Tim44 family)
MSVSRNHLLRSLVVIIAFTFIFFIMLDAVAHARAGGGRSSGSRGFSSGGSFQRSSPTRTSPSSQQPGVAQQPGQQPQAATPGRSFLYGLGGGLMGGMIGNMLFGGRGYAGGEGSGGGGFGFGDLIIILIIIGIIWYVVKRFKARREMQMSAANAGGYGSYAYNDPQYEQAYAPSSQDTVSAGLRHIGEMDQSFNENTFKENVEDMFFRIQSGWTKRDLSAVRNLLTSQMLNTFQTDINDYAAKKQFNRLENIAVRQVEIVDAAQDQGEEYITVRFLASLLDYVTDESTGNVISGSSTDPVKFLEYWTFMRKVGEKNWMLAGITQEKDY